MNKNEFDRAYPTQGEKYGVLGIGVVTTVLTISMLRSAYKRDFAAATFKAVWLGNINRNFEADLSRRLGRSRVTNKVKSERHDLVSDIMNRRVR